MKQTASLLSILQVEFNLITIIIPCLGKIKVIQKVFYAFTFFLWRHGVSNFLWSPCFFENCSELFYPAMNLLSMLVKALSIIKIFATTTHSRWYIFLQYWSYRVQSFISSGRKNILVYKLNMPIQISCGAVCFSAATLVNFLFHFLV